MANCTLSKNDSLKLRLVAWDKNSKSEVSTAGYATTLDLTLKAKKNWSSVVQHLSKKWVKVDNVMSRLQLFSLDTITQQPTVNYLTSFGSLSVGNTLCTHPALSVMKRADGIPMFQLYYHFASPQLSSQVFPGQNLLSNLHGSGVDDLRVSRIPKEIVYGQQYTGTTRGGGTMSQENTLDAICEVVHAIYGDEAKDTAAATPTGTEQYQQQGVVRSSPHTQGGVATIKNEKGLTPSAIPEPPPSAAQHRPPHTHMLRPSVNDLPLLLSALSPPEGMPSPPAAARPPCTPFSGSTRLTDERSGKGHVLGEDTMACLADLNGQSLLSPPPKQKRLPICSDGGGSGARASPHHTVAPLHNASAKSGAIPESVHNQCVTDGTENSVIHLSDSIVHFLCEFGQDSNTAIQNDGVETECKDKKRKPEEMSSKSLRVDMTGVVAACLQDGTPQAAKAVAMPLVQASGLAVQGQVPGMQEACGDEKRRRVEVLTSAHDLNGDELQKQPSAVNHSIPQGADGGDEHCPVLQGGAVVVCDSGGESNLSGLVGLPIQPCTTKRVCRHSPDSVMVILSDSSHQGGNFSDSSTCRSRDDSGLGGCGVPLSIRRPNSRKPHMKRITPTFVSKLPSRS